MMTKTKTKVVVCRKWHNPSIETWVSNKEIGMAMSVDDYLTALVEEVGNPTMMFTKATLLAKLKSASPAVISGIKETSKEIV